jgi:hypothetical protein
MSSLRILSWRYVELRHSINYLNLINDTLTYQLAQDTLRVTVDLANSIPQNSNSTFIDKEWIPVVGMTLVALITIISQHLLTRRTTKSEFDKIRSQMESDFTSKIRFDWISSFRSKISELITSTDPEFNEAPDYLSILSLINYAQLMLSEYVPEEQELGSMLSELGLLTYIREKKDVDNVTKSLMLQAKIVNQTKLVINKKLQLPRKPT